MVDDDNAFYIFKKGSEKHLLDHLISKTYKIHLWIRGISLATLFRLLIVENDGMLALTV